MDSGSDAVRALVGVEATGKPFDAFNYSDQALTGAHINPMINTGAIALCTLIHGASYEEKFARLLELTCRLAGNPELSVDEAVYRALKALRQLREPEYFETWLTRILLNECHRELRRRKRFSFGEEALPESAGPDVYDGLPLKEAVLRLPEELRAVVVLRFFGGYSQKETAQALQIPQGTVATRQRRALALLRLELGEEGDA
jgi:RNA polymerase sigma-70 factor (ECF subfamily)